MFDCEAPVPEVKVFKMSLNMVGFTLQVNDAKV